MFGEDSNPDLIFQVEQITQEYKALALQCHPDKNNGDKEAEARFQKLKVSSRVIIILR